MLDGLIRGVAESLAVLDFGLFQVHADGRRIGLCGFLIRTDRGEVILVDTGLPPKYAADLEKASLEDNLGAFGKVLELTEQNLPAAQLARLDLTLDDVDLLVLTHTHIDHVGSLGAFTDRTILLSRHERALERPLYWGDCHPIAWPSATYVTIDEDCDLCSGVRLLHVAGHTPGQLALLVHLPRSGAILLTSDAISRPAEIEQGFDGAWNPDMAAASAKRLMAIADQERATVIYGHCPEQWPNLPKAPHKFE